MKALPPWISFLQLVGGVGETALSFSCCFLIILLGKTGESLRLGASAQTDIRYLFQWPWDISFTSKGAFLKSFEGIGHPSKLQNTSTSSSLAFGYCLQWFKVKSHVSETGTWGYYVPLGQCSPDYVRLSMGCWEMLQICTRASGDLAKCPGTHVSGPRLRKRCEIFSRWHKSCMEDCCIS